MLEWFLKTELSFDIGIFITLVISIIGFWHKGKKDKEESKKQKERYEKESEDRFKAIEKQISMQKEVEKEMIVRNYNIEILDAVEKEREFIAKILSKTRSYQLSIKSFGELINRGKTIKNLISDIIFYDKCDEEFYVDLLKMKIEKERYECERIIGFIACCSEGYANLSNNENKNYCCNVMQMEAYYIMLGTDLRYAKKYEHLNFKKNKNSDEIKKLIEEHDQIINNELEQLKYNEDRLFKKGPVVIN